MNRTVLQELENSPASPELEFESFFQEHYPRVYGIVYRLIGNRVDAEDWTLEAFWRLWTRFSQPIDNKAGWLYRVAVRLAYNGLRSSKRRTHYEEKAGEFQASVPSTPDREWEESRTRERVREALKQISERNAEILILRHSGLSYKEIASVLQISPGSVGTLLLRAEKEFARLYEKGVKHASE